MKTGVQRTCVKLPLLAVCLFGTCFGLEREREGQDGFILDILYPMLKPNRNYSFLLFRIQLRENPSGLSPAKP